MTTGGTSDRASSGQAEHCPPGWRTTGTGESGTVLMLHSIGVDGASFDELRLALPETWRIATFDMHGHGKTLTPHAISPRQHFSDYVEDAARAAENCGGSALHLVGHSMGGAIAAALAARLDCVVSLSAVASPPSGFPAFSQRAADVRAHGMHAAVAPTLSRWFSTKPDHSTASRSAHAYAKSCLEHLAAEHFAQAWDALAEFEGYAPLIDRLPRTLLLAGEIDQSTPPSVMAGIRTAFANVGKVERVTDAVVEGAGHMLPLTHAEKVAQVLVHHWTATSDH